MSTILKALRRLEEEKAAAEEPRPLREQIASAPRAGDGPRRRGWLGAATALVLGVAAGGGLIWWLFAGSPETIQVASATPVPEPAPAAPAPAPPIQPPAVSATVAAALAAGPPDQAYESDVEIVERPDALPRLADSEPIAAADTEPKRGSTRPVETSAAMERMRQAALAEYAAAERARRGLPPAPSPAEPAVEPAPAEPQPTKIVAVAPDILVQAPEPPPPPQPAPEPVQEAKPAASPPPEPKPVREAAAPRPAPEPVREAPAPPPADLPSFAIEKTQWHPLADRRVAWLRMPGESEPRRVVEGDVIDGLLVARIEPSGVVFERDGKKIQRVLGQR